MMSPLPFFKTFLFIFFLLLFSLLSLPGEASARSFKTPTSLSFPNIEANNKVVVKVRKIMEVNSLLLDYDPPGANPAHEPPKRGTPRGTP